MKNVASKAVAGVLMFLAMMFFAASGFGAEQKESLSPYFFVKGGTDVESFPLLKTDVKVDIAGIGSEVELTQTYKNDGKKTIEALYCFPLGTRAAIHAMKMKIGSRIIEAEIHQNDEARKIYEQAKNNGQTASLLEQKRPNVFQMNVANIMPGDIVEVTVNYTEILVPEDGVYTFVYPTVVGPRYTGSKETPMTKAEQERTEAQNTVPGGVMQEDGNKDAWTKAPYTHQGDAPSYDLGMTVNINPGMEVASVSSPSHRISTDWDNGKAKVTLADGEKKSGNRDFVLRYSLKGKQIQAGVLLYPGDKENFFVMMMQPPARPEASMIPPREYFFILDVSGSMYGYPLEISKQVIKKILAGLSSRDYFNVMFFSGGADTLFKHSMPATAGNMGKAVKMIEAAQGSGGTEIINALRTAFAKEKKPGMSRSFVIMTDGYVSVEKDVFDLMRAKMGEANFFPFGIGTSVNRYLMEGMARIGKGEPFVALNQEEGEKMADKFVNYVKAPVLTDINVKFDGFDAYDVEPVSVPDLFAERPLVVMGKYHKSEGKIVVTGRSGNGDFKRELSVAPQMYDSKNIALKYMWARERIARLADYSRVGVDVKADVTDLGLQYGLMTEYTSFVAVDKEVRPTGEVVTVKQPLPLPEGVSDLAVGNEQAASYSSMRSAGLPASTSSAQGASTSSAQGASTSSAQGASTSSAQGASTSSAQGASTSSAQGASTSSAQGASTSSAQGASASPAYGNMAEEAAAPVMCKKEKAISGYGRYKTAAEDKDDASASSAQGVSAGKAQDVTENIAQQASSGEIYLSDAKLPDNVDINTVEKAILGAVQTELDVYFAQNGLTGVRLELKVENGSIKAIKVLSYKGSAAPLGALEKIMAKVKIGSVSGTLEVTLETE